MRAAYYARVSSAAQRERDTIASQHRELPEFCALRGWPVVAAFEDDGLTAKAGRLAARTGLAAMLRAAAAGEFDVLVVLDVDRLTRAEDLGERGAILGALQRAGVKIASVIGGQVLDLSTSTGDLLSTLHAFFAAEWGRKHRERIVAAKITALQRGRKPSGPTPYGHSYDRATGTWSVDPVRAPIMVEIFERVVAGESTRVLADDLHERGVPRPRGAWTRERVWALLRSRHVVGEWIGDKRRRLVVKVPPIISEALWQRAQEALMAHGKRGLRRTKHVYLLEGLAVCGACGAPMLIRSATRARNGHVNPAAYVCRRRKLQLRGVTRCGAPIVRVADVDARVWAKVCSAIDDPSLAVDLAAAEQRVHGDRHDWDADLVVAQKHLARLERVEAGVLARFRRDLVSEAALELELTALRREREAVRMQISAAERGRREAVDAVEQLEVLTIDLLRVKLAASQDLAAQRELVAVVVDRGGAIFRGADVEITLRFAVATVGSRGAAGVGPALALVPGSGYRTAAECELTIRLVA